MLDILLLALQVITLVLLFLFIWWVVRSAREDLVAARGDGPGQPSSVHGWGQEPRQWQEPASSPGSGVAGEWYGEPVTPAGVADWAAPTAAGAAAFGTSDGPSGAAHPPAPIESAAPIATPDTPGQAATTAAASGDDPDSRRSRRAAERAAVDDRLDMTAFVRPRLVVESSPTLQPGTEISLESSLGIGRSPGSDLVLDDPFVSSTHARIVKRDQFSFVEDLGSTNGTYVNERVVTEAQLRPDSRLRVGETVFRYKE